MKKITFILLAFIGTSAMAQDPGISANANASADIVSPLTITKDADLDFGKIVSETTATTIILGQDGLVDAASTGNSISTSNQSAAGFTITATDTYNFSVTVPSTITLAGTGGGSDMLVTLDPSLPATSNKSEGEPITLLIGGTLDVGANQTEGNYTTSFDVTVAYE